MERKFGAVIFLDFVLRAILFSFMADSGELICEIRVSGRLMKKQESEVVISPLESVQVFKLNSRNIRSRM